MNKATAPDADQRDRFFGGSDRAGKPILRRSLVVRFGCYLTLLVSLALIGMFSALLFADYTHQDAAVINHAGSLRMLTYRVALEPSLEGRQALLGTLGERLDSGDIRRLLQRQDADDPIRQLHQELREGLARLDPRAARTRRAGRLRRRHRPFRRHPPGQGRAPLATAQHGAGPVPVPQPAGGVRHPLRPQLSRHRPAARTHQHRPPPGPRRGWTRGSPTAARTNWRNWASASTRWPAS